MALVSFLPPVITFHLHPLLLDEAELNRFSGSSSEFLSVAGWSFFCESLLELGCFEFTAAAAALLHPDL